MTHPKTVAAVLDCAQDWPVSKTDHNILPAMLFLKAASNHRKNLITAFSTRTWADLKTSNAELFSRT
jgi:hypothetical protein